MNTGKKLDWVRVIAYDPLSLPKKGGSLLDEWRRRMKQVYQVSFLEKLKEYKKAVEEETEGVSKAMAKDVLSFIPSFTKIQQQNNSSAILISQQPEPTDMELEMLKTSQIVLDSEANIVPLESYLTSLQQPDHKTEYSLFTLDLMLLTREPEIIKKAAKTISTETKIPTPEQTASLESLRKAVLEKQ